MQGEINIKNPMVISDQWDRMETMGTGRSGGMFTQGRRNRLWIVELGGSSRGMKVPTDLGS